MSKKKSKSSRIAIVVLGMHRSGTSALAGVLNILGCDKPATVMDPNPFNELVAVSVRPVSVVREMARGSRLVGNCARAAGFLRWWFRLGFRRLRRNDSVCIGCWP